MDLYIFYVSPQNHTMLVLKRTVSDGSIYFLRFSTKPYNVGTQKNRLGVDDMDEAMYDPRELFQDVAVLITEARSPDLSMKGRVEGPHCPQLQGASGHTCDRHKEQCRKANDLFSQQEILWRNKIPMRLDVLLFPNCDHGVAEATIMEGASLNSLDEFVLLERWDVQLVKKRSTEKLDGFVSGRIHLQAIRSYLHFCQLSSWLISTGGTLPLQIVYRVYAPGESVGYTFDKLPLVHNFPSADQGDFVMRSTVTHLPRQDAILRLVCRSPSPSFEQHLRRKCPSDGEQTSGASGEFCYEPIPSTSKCDDANFEQTGVKQKKRHSKDHMEYGKESKKGKQPLVSQKPPSGRKSSEKGENLDNQIRSKDMSYGPCPVSHTPKRKVDQLSPSRGENLGDKYSSYCEEKPSCSYSNKSPPSNIQKPVTMVTKQAVIPPSSLSILKSVSSDSKHSKLPGQVSPTKCHPYRKPSTMLTISTVTAPYQLVKRLPSPKVLVTGSKRPESSMFKKRCLDFDKPESIAEVAGSDDFATFTELDAFASTDIQELVKPLSPSQLEAYLSSLSNKPPKRAGMSHLDQIPTTKCKFYIGEVEKSVAVVKESEKDQLDTNTSTDTTLSLSENIHYAKPCVQSKQTAVCKNRKPFQKSLSTSEIEPDVFHDEVSNILEIGSKSKYDGTSDNKTDSKSPEQLGTSMDTNTLDILLEVKTRLDSLKSSEGDIEPSVIPVATAAPDSDTAMHNQHSHTQASLSCTDTKQTSKREKILDGLTIPCKVGKVPSAMTDIIQNLESMDIDTRSRHSSGSASLDTEVEKHLTNGSTSKHSPTNSTDISDADLLNKRLSLHKQLLTKEFHQNVQKEIDSPGRTAYKNLPSPDDIVSFQSMMGRSANIMFNSSTGLPTRSSPAPIKKPSGSFDYDCNLTNVQAIKNALSCSKLTLQSEDNSENIEDPRIISASAPASTNCLLGNFEESVLNGRIEPVGVVDGFTVEIGAGGTFCPRHVSLPVAAYFFQLSDDNAPSPYLGHVNLDALGKRGYHIPRTGTVQVTLFNPNKTVVKMFVVMYDLSNMPANCQTFLRQRTVYMPVDGNSSEPSFLRYLIHLRFASSKSGKVYLHTDIRLIFARDKFEFDPQVANYELRSFTEGPVNPKFSPKR